MKKKLAIQVVSVVLCACTLFSCPVDASTLSDAPLQDMIAEMSLSRKAAQMMLAGCSDEASALAAAAGGAGALCVFAPPFQGKTAAQVQAMTAKWQAAADIPLLIAVDEEGGTVNRVSLNSQLRSKPFTGAMQLYGTGGLAGVTADAVEKADFLRNLGINANLAPVCDVPLRTTDYIYKRCYSMQAEEAADCVSGIVHVMRERQVGTTLKHFPGYGGSTDTHKSIAYDKRSLTEFRQRDLLPFAAGIAAGADSVMVSHNIVACMDANYPASLSKAVHTFLREEMGFNGVIITDALEMNAITQFMNGRSPAVVAVLAGNDMLCANTFQGSVDAIVAAVEDGTIAESSIDASVLRILRWKQSLGLLANICLLYGDTDGNGRLTMADGILLARCLAEMTPPTSPEACDANRDGLVDVTDLACLLEALR